MARTKKKKRITNETSASGSDPAPPAPHDGVCRAYLMVTAFCAGASVMIVELAGHRILAPMFGNSLYTWTGLIGVILVSISCGYYLGGYLADKRPRYVLLVHLLAISAILTMLVPMLYPSIETHVDGLGVVWGPVFATALLFALPGLLLASASPFAVRLTSLLWQDRNVGVSAGCVGTFGTLGSVAGTFGTGFVLVPSFGIRSIFLITGSVIAGLAVIGYLLFSPVIRRNRVLILLPIVLLAAVGTVAHLSKVNKPPTVIFDRTTSYHKIRVVEQSVLAPVTGQEIDKLRTLLLDTTTEGSQFVRLRQVPPDYQRFWELAPLFCPQLKRAAFLGGGAFTMPQALLDGMPHASVDVAEIDPAIVDVGRQYFRLDAEEYKDRLHVVDCDARRFLRISETDYDLIFADAYHGKRSIPAHLVTLEFFQLVKSRLNDRGVLIVNIAGAFGGEDAIVFESVVRTVGEVFPSQCVFATNPGLPEESQNAFIVAASHDLNVAGLLSSRRDEEGSIQSVLEGYVTPDQYTTSNGLVFTDDYNPVEYLVSGTL